MTVPPLGYKKWGLVDQGLVTDFAAPGLSPPCLYDHLAQTTLSRGVIHSVPAGMEVLYTVFVVVVDVENVIKVVLLYLISIIYYFISNVCCSLSSAFKSS